MRVLASYPYQTHKPTPKGEPKVMPWIATATISFIVAAGMMDWSSTEWTIFIGAIVGGVVTVLGAIVTAFVKIMQAINEVKTAAKTNIPPAQAQAMVNQAVASVKRDEQSSATERP